MTESDWLAGNDVQRMLAFLTDRAGERPLRLFACACCRQAWHLLPDRMRWLVTVAERFADGLATPEELFDAEQLARRQRRPRDAGPPTTPAGQAAEAALGTAFNPDTLHVAG